MAHHDSNESAEKYNVSRRTLLKTVPATALGGGGVTAFATDTTAAHGPLQAYKNAVRKLDDLAQSLGEPNEQAWYSQVKGHSQQANNTMARLVKQGHRFRATPKGNGVELEIMEPSQARAPGYGHAPRAERRGAGLTLAVGGGVLMLFMLSQSAPLIASGVTGITQAGFSLVAAQTTSVGTGAVSNPYPNSKMATGAQGVRGKWRKYFACWEAHRIADIVGDNTDVPKVEKAIDTYLQKTGRCPKSVDQLQEYVDDTVEFVQDLPPAGPLTFSFEEAAPGNPPADPWRVVNGTGFQRVSADHATDGNQSLHLGGAPIDDPSAVGVDIDLSTYNTLLYDIWAVSNDPDRGDIKIALDAPGPLGGTNIDNVHADINTNGPGTGENQWHRDISLDLSPYSGTRTVVLFVAGNNEVYWDNLRFQS